jgi:hypothetical protein
MDRPTAALQTEAFSIGIAYWPGGLESDWGSPTTGLQPCDPAVQANLVRGVSLAAAALQHPVDSCCGHCLAEKQQQHPSQSVHLACLLPPADLTRSNVYNI